MLITVVGCDARYYYLCKKLKKFGHKTLLCGISPLQEDESIAPAPLFDGIEKCDVLILPVPLTRDGVHLNMPCYKEKIKLCDIFAKLKPDTMVFGGGEYKNKHYTNYLTQNFVTGNSLITAEGAAFVAMQNKKSTLFGSKCLVVGFGNLGRALCKLLKNMGCRVTATARKQSDFEDMVLFGYGAAHTNSISDIVGGFDAVFSTVPHPVITKPVLSNANPNTLFIELASSPYGIDFSAAEELNLNAVNLPALPAKYAPVSAGNLIAETVQNLILTKENRE